MADGDGVVNNGGLELHLTNSSDELTEVLNVKRVSMPKIQFAKAEVTNQADGGVKRHKVGMGEYPDLTAVIGYEPGGPDDLLIEEHKLSKEDRPFKVVVVKEDGTLREGTGTIQILTFEPDDGTMGGERTATLTGIVNALTEADEA